MESLGTGEKALLRDIEANTDTSLYNVAAANAAAPSARRSLAVTTFAAVVASIVVRVGGRSAIIGGLGVAPPER